MKKPRRKGNSLEPPFGQILPTPSVFCGFNATASFLNKSFPANFLHLPTLVEIPSSSGQTHRMVFPVLKRIHCGMGLFCFCALASFCFVRKDLWLWFGKKSLAKSVQHRLQLLLESGSLRGQEIDIAVNSG